MTADSRCACGSKGADANTLSSGFASRHIGFRPEERAEMLRVVGAESAEDLVNRTVPAGIRLRAGLNLPAAAAEHEVLEELRALAAKNKVYRSLIGMGFADTVTPPVIQRTILENPGWYTQYTPYQAEISQGRLEALLNFQTMVSSLTGMELSNASLLDEGSAAAEAMAMCFRLKGSGKRRKILAAADLHPPTIAVLQTRAEPLGLEVVVAQPLPANMDDSYFAVLVQYPSTDGLAASYAELAEAAHSCGALVIAAAELLSLAVLVPPGEWGADAVVGSSQRFGVPLGYGGPHAAFLAATEACRRELPGRLVGVSKDSSGKPALRLALQTREQHIRREKATSNICTAQVLLAIMASMYAVYHGPDGLRNIARRIHRLTSALRLGLERAGISCRHSTFFDTLRTEPLGSRMEAIVRRAERQAINLRLYEDGSLGVTLDEKSSGPEIEKLLLAFAGPEVKLPCAAELLAKSDCAIPQDLRRKSAFLEHAVFNSYHSETEMLRYITRLQSKDLSLAVSMIPLGSCTMKLNAAAEMLPVSWPEFAGMHPFAPITQAAGYQELIAGLEQMLAEITGMHAVSLQPNAGSQGEYSGLLVIRAYHRSQGGEERRVCLIPHSAHGTNPASAAMAGLQVVVVDCDEQGNIDTADLARKAAEHSKDLACLMVTYPSTHGVFEERIEEICRIIHASGGLVYMDGANMNAQVGLCRPGDFGVDVCHLNLHKTFAIPHGGGGPGVGPIAVVEKLADFLPGHPCAEVGGSRAIGPVCSSPWGSAGVFVIPWAYIRLMGADGLREATIGAILNANYVAKRLENYFPVLYKGRAAMVAHECILDLRKYKRSIGIDVSDVAKRLMDYGFHAPTVSFPVVETLMVEPTESESKAELDRFCDALIAIHGEMSEVEEGRADRSNNVLKNSPHTAQIAASDEWSFPYTREKAAYPLPWLKDYKFWPAVGRIDNTWGDRNLFCSCPPVQE